ncbi:MAG: YgfZ/GcvT domain-containing protein [Solirubrobacterales bacterium]
MSVVDQIASEYAALTESAAVVRRAQPGVLALTGDDAAEFLQGQVTNDVEALQPGDGHYAALLTPKGKMRADMRVLRTAETLLVVADAGQLPVIRHTIDTFRIGYFFTTEDRSEGAALASVIGPRADEFTSALGDLPADTEAAIAEFEFHGEPLVAIRTQLGIDLLGMAGAVDKAIKALTEAGVVVASEDAAQIIRVEHAIPSFGAELDENTIPGEAGLNERAVNFEKGCYVGQETVARMHYKGKPNRVLRLLRAGAPLQAGAAVTASDGRELGQIGTAVESPAQGAIALAVLRREAESGTKVDAGGVAASVLDVDSFRS